MQALLRIDERTLLLEKPMSRPRLPQELLMGGAVLLHSLAHLGYRELGEEGFRPQEVILLRSLVTTAACVVLGRVLHVPSPVLGPRGSRRVLLARGGLGCLGLGLFFGALAVLPPNDAVALTFLSPCFSVLLAHWFLGEPLSGVCLVSTILGFVGVAAVHRPAFLASGGVGLLGLLLALSSSLANAGSTVLVRHAGGDVHFLHLVGYLGLLPILPAFGACLLSPGLVARVTLQHCGWGVAASGASFLGNILFVLSLQQGRVAAVANFLFLQALFASTTSLSTLAILASVYFGSWT